MINEDDGNGNGTMDFDEFVVMMTKPEDVDEEEEELKNFFSLLDKDGNGKIVPWELKHYMLNYKGERLSD